MPSVVDLTPQSQEAPLSDASLDKLRDLVKTYSSGQTALDKHLVNSAKYAAEAAGAINESAHSSRARFLKRKNQLTKNGEEISGDEVRDFEASQKRVQVQTKKLDAATRQVIDDSVYLQDVPNLLNYVIDKSHTATQQLSQWGEQDDMSDDERPTQSDPLTRRPNPSEEPMALLHAAMSTKEASWKSKTPTARYSENNDYIDFYRAVYHAQNPGENAPPMPHANQWFAVEEGRGPKAAAGRGAGSSSQRQRINDSQTQRETGIPGTQNMVSLQSDDEDEEENDTSGNPELEDDDSGSDIEVQSEKIRITCPFTLRPFENPYRSTKCPHAFEKEYILDFLHKSTEQMPLTESIHLELSQITQPQARSRRERELRPKMVKCPECDVPLTEKDLRPDPVLQKIVRREVERRRKREEAQNRGDTTIDAEMDSDEDEDVESRELRRAHRRNVVNIGSSPVRTRLSGRFVKNEGLSIVPQTQAQDTYEDVDDQVMSDVSSQ